MSFTYLLSKPNPATPDGYICAKCKASGVKLWREYQTMCPNLLCGPCAMTDQEKDGDLEEDGRRADCDGVKTDQIGWYVPAVPDEQGEGYWGYTSVPAAGVAWWKALPLRAPDLTEHAAVCS
jgi:hypothetical protein